MLSGCRRSSTVPAAAAARRSSFATRGRLRLQHVRATAGRRFGICARQQARVQHAGSSACMFGCGRCSEQVAAAFGGAMWRLAATRVATSGGSGGGGSLGSDWAWPMSGVRVERVLIGKGQQQQELQAAITATACLRARLWGLKRTPYTRLPGPLFHVWVCVSNSTPFSFLRASALRTQE